MQEEQRERRVRTVFVRGSDEADYLDVYLAILNALRGDFGCDFKVFRTIKQVQKVNKDVDSIYDVIKFVDIFIIDISVQPPTSIFELGYAYALGNDTIVLKQNFNVLPSNLEINPPISYDRGQLKLLLTDPLRYALVNILSGGDTIANKQGPCLIAKDDVSSNFEQPSAHSIVTEAPPEAKEPIHQPEAQELPPSSETTKIGSDKLTVFIYYHETDEQYFDELYKMLKLSEKNLFKVFSPKNIQKGTKWKEQLEANLEKATLALTLISVEFLSSESLRAKTLLELLSKAREKNKHTISLFVDPLQDDVYEEWEELEPINKPDSALSTIEKLSDRRIVYSKVVTAIVEIMNEALDQKTNKTVNDPLTGTPSGEESDSV